MNHHPETRDEARQRAAIAMRGRNEAGLRVLVVDDEDAVRRMACESLKRAGFAVVAAHDGVEAVGIIRDSKPSFDAVLLDMVMPRMTGVDAYAIIKRLLPDLPVVLTSGHSEEDVTARFQPGGLAGFVKKPFLPATLVQAMDRAVRRDERSATQ
jgi:CheY-like chemotaxis protein